ncbi:MAG: ABC-F family ATP-binding cassette domain-containing protein [Clostridiaceae bacterium]|nr:ABC-F family ATP-binding cassette domain-containing protein [Clostridiaceae bacterium]
MSQISLKNIDKSYYEKDVLVDVDLQINPGDKLAIIGENGAGKTTLFRIILGLEQPDSENAEIIVAKNIVIGHLEQELSNASNESNALYDAEIYQTETKINKLTKQIAINNEEDQNLLREYAKATAKFESLDGYNYRYKLKSILAGLGISEETAHRPLSELSGGERMRISLARLLLKEPDVMLLDEPTNHLDHIATEWLEEFLTSTKSTVIFISHDRAFIDQIATKTAELEHGKLTLYNGNFSKFASLKKERESFLNKEISKLEDQVQRQAEITQTMLSHRKIGSYRSSQKKSRRLQARLNDLKSSKSKNPTSLKFDILKGIDLGDPNKIILSVKDLSVTFEGQSHSLFKPFSFSLRGKEKVIIVGKNGCGKTTLINSLLGEEKAAEGIVRLTKDIKYGVLRQLVEFFDESHTVIESLQWVDPHLTEGAARNRLALYGFRNIDVFKQLHTLSGGERRRLYLCHLLTENPDILFLDEPTNHLDINSSEILENALLNYEGAILAVSHDRYFIEKIGQYVLGFVDNEIKPYPNYKSFRLAEKNAYQKNSKQNDHIIKKRMINQSDENHSNNNINQNKEELVHTKKNNDLFSKQDLRLQQNLVNINHFPTNPVQTRKFRAISQEALSDLERKMNVCETKKIELEKNFSDAKDEKIYTEYDHLLKLIENYENLYLKILELQEQLD